MKRLPPARIFGAAVLTLAAACSGLASDHSNLEEGLPTRVEDTYALPYRAMELQFSTAYLNLPGREQQYRFVPRLEYGFARNWQATLSSPLLAGPGDHRGSGNTEVEVFHNFNTEGLRLPAFAASFRADFPSGVDTDGVDTRLKFIATKSVSNHTLQRVHVNAEYLHNAGRLPDERKERYAVTAGYQAALSTSTMLVADVYREQQITRHMDYNMAQVGIREQITPFSVFVVGVGAGVGPDSPRFQVTIGLQHDFGGR